MKNILNKINSYLVNYEALGSLFLRLGIGIAFIIHGWNKFPLPPQGLIDYFDLSPTLASFVALSELGVGITLIIAGFFKNPYGNIITRISGLIIIIIMINIFAIAHQDWFITKKLFTSEQIFLFIGGVYFFLKGNEK